MTERAGTEAYAASSSGSGTLSAGKMKAQLDLDAEAAKTKIDSVREPIAEKIRGAADSLRAQGERMPGGATVAGAAQGAADTLEASASYIESHNTQQMVEDVMAIVKNNPVQALLIAGALGFLIARAFRRT